MRGREGFFGARGMTSRGRGAPGMALQGRGDSGITRPLCVTSEIIFITLPYYNFYYFVPLQFLLLCHFIIFIILSLLLSFILNILQRPQVFKNVSRQHDIPFKIKIFAERYLFYHNNFYYFVPFIIPFIVLYIEHIATFPSFSKYRSTT